MMYIHTFILLKNIHFASLRSLHFVAIDFCCDLPNSLTAIPSGDLPKVFPILSLTTRLPPYDWLLISFPLRP